MFLMGLDQNTLKGIIIVGLLKERQAGHCSIEHVVDLVAGRNASLSRHRRHDTQWKPSCQNELRPLFFARQIITRIEREKLGLTPHTWQGVVHADVYPSLKKLSALAEALKARLRQRRDEKADGLLRRINMQGMVYVEVSTRDDAQRRVLASLRASEFHARQVFDKASGFVGYASAPALDKLAKNPDVIGVCLDNKPLPDSPPIFFKPDDENSAFKKASHINISISLTTDAIPRANDLPSGFVREQKIREIQDRVLTIVNADEVRVWGKIPWSTLVSAFATRDGLDKLRRSPDIIRVETTSRLIKLPKPGSPQ